MFDTEVAAAGLLTHEGVTAHEFAQVEEIGNAADLFKRLVDTFGASEHTNVLLELLAKSGDLRQSLLETVLVAFHAAVVPDELAEFTVVVLRRLGATDRQPTTSFIAHGLLCLDEHRIGGRDDALAQQPGEVVAHCVGSHEVAVGQTLHERRCAETVGTVIGEVGLTEGVEARHGGHEVVVNPQATHRVMAGGVDAHRDLHGVLVGDALVHVEEVAVTLEDGVVTEPVDRLAEVEEDAVLERANATTLITHNLGGTRGDVTGSEVAVGRVLTLEVVVAVFFRDLIGRTVVVELLGHPDATVVTQRLRHERELGLRLITGRDAGGVDLRVAGVGEQGALLVCPPCCGDVGVHRVGGQVEGVAVAAGAQQGGVTRPALDLAAVDVAGDDADRHAVLLHDVEQFGLGVELDTTERHLLHEGLVGAE
ncbi:unannotated protein [freshwater metagenome]|uniref:Unannotated protein n=1 Tax=freshwater metagenome TaxID=449393 RepID=A0A6J7JCY1_9ZZZZ